MSTHRIPLQTLLTDEEDALVREFGRCLHANPAARVQTMARVLQTEFGLELARDPDIVAGFEQDSSNLPGKAEAVVRPRSERECALVLAGCQAGALPCTISAGRSNLTGSATPEGGIVLSCINLATPEPEIDEAGGTITSPVGIILEDMREQVLRRTDGRLHFPVDPTSRADACLGGVLACNASGFTPGPAGAVRAWVEAVDFLLPDGSKITARRGEYLSDHGRFLLCGRAEERELPVPTYQRPRVKNAGGPFSTPDGSMDLVDLVVGSEGIFGMITACTLRLAPAPPGYLDMFFSLPGEAEALKLHACLHRKLGGFEGLSALEYFGVNCRAYMDHEEVLFAGDNQVGVNIQVPLRERELEEEAEAWLQLLAEADCGVEEDAILLLDEPRARRSFLEARHSLPANALERVQQRGTITIMTDTVVPREQFAAFLDFTHHLIQEHGLEYLAFGHFGDCHLHFTILPERDQLETGLGLYDRIVAESARLGGVYSGEHGTGKRKRADFLACYGQEAAGQVLRTKSVIDPRLLLNRGNVVIPPDTARA